MANFHSDSFALAGSREAVNRAILLMAQNIAAASGSTGSVDEPDDPAESFSVYRRDLDESYYAAFAGAESLGRYLSDTASVRFVDGGETCAVCLRYATAGMLNDDDLNTYFEALAAQTCAFKACVIHGDEYDGYDQLRVNYYSAEGTGEWDAAEDDEWPTAGDLARELRRIYRVGKIRDLTDAKEMAYASAVAMWDDWEGESVFETLWESGIFGEDADKEEACSLFYDYPEDVTLYYARCRSVPLTRDKIEEA